MVGENVEIIIMGHLGGDILNRVEIYVLSR